MIDHATFFGTAAEPHLRGRSLEIVSILHRSRSGRDFDIEYLGDNGTKSGSTACSSSSRPATATNSASWKSGSAGV